MIVYVYPCRDYRGEVKVILFNHSDEPFSVTIGARIAQLILERIAIMEVEEVTGELPPTVRGGGGFGSTGTASIILEHAVVSSGPSDVTENAPISPGSSKRARTADEQ